MRKHGWIFGILFCMLCVVIFGAAQAQPAPSALAASMEEALLYLENRMDETTGDLYVYRDYAVNENHFAAKGRISAEQEEALVYNMDENWTDDPYEGDSCIRCSVGYSPTNWGGWMFINGVLEEGQTVPSPVWGDVDGCALDLSGAACLTFKARGELGGEVVEFFMGGLGYNAELGIPVTAYPDSTAKITTGHITLTDEWKEYTIDLTDADLSAVGCGFGFAVVGAKNFLTAVANDGDITFYLDDIRYRGGVIPVDTPRFIASYETENPYIRNAAFTYDNALCALAFTAAGEQERAKLILDAFLMAIENDRFASDRIRNAYVYGSPESFPGWGGRTRLPGFMMDGAFCEDRYQVGSNLGNISFAALAFLQYYVRYGGEEYLQAARTIVDFALNSWADTNGDGFFAGYDGWPENGTVYPFSYKSVEHNLDFYAACAALYQITGDAVYSEAALSALRLIDRMYDEDLMLFWSGTTEDRATPNTSNVVLDVQVWSALALGEAGTPYLDSVRYTAENLHTPGGGYAFSQSDRDGGYWLEGTAFSALAFRQCGMDAEADAALGAVMAAQLSSGGFPAVAGAASIDTGFALFTGEAWQYSDDPHIAPAAWYILAVLNANPYVVGL